MGFAISVNWYEEYRKDYEKWDNLGRRAIEQNCKHKTQDTGRTSERTENMSLSKKTRTTQTAHCKGGRNR